MVGKATITDVTDEGFTPQAFGMPPNWLTASTGYIATILARASNWASQQITPTNYTAAVTGNYSFDCLVLAEVRYATDILWTRRAAFLDGNANMAMDGQLKAQLIAQAYANAKEARQDRDYWITEAQRAFGMDPTLICGTGVSSGYIETGPYPNTSASPINAASP
jgi:hypothetical protein